MRPLPTPEPPASATPLLPRDDTAAPKKHVLDDDAKDAAKAKRPAADASAAKVPGSTPSPAESAGAAPTGAAGSGAVAIPSAPPFAAPSAACLSRCQGAMQGCLSAPVDGGVPGFSNLDLCKKAFEACQSACTKS